MNFIGGWDIKKMMAQAIREYESDTFSADLAKITDPEAYALARFFIRRFLGGGNVKKPATGENALEGMGIDGMQIDEVLQWYRDGELKKGSDY